MNNNNIRALLILLLSLACSVTSKADDENYVQAQVKDPFIELRTGPGSSFPIFYVAEQGEWIEVLLSKTIWYKVRLATEIEGWVHKDQLKKTFDVEGNQLEIYDPDFASFVERNWEIGVFSGDFEGAASITLFGGYHFTKNLTAGIAVTQALGNFSEIRTASVQITHEPFPELQPFTWIPWIEQVGLSPFFGIGAGAMETLPRATLVDVLDREDNILYVTGGAKLYLTRQFILHIEYRNNSILTNRNENEKAEEWKIGFSIFF